MYAMPLHTLSRSWRSRGAALLLMGPEPPAGGEGMEEEALPAQPLARLPRLAARAVHVLKRRQRLLLELGLGGAGGVDEGADDGQQSEKTEAHAHRLLPDDLLRGLGEPAGPLVAGDVDEDDAEGEDVHRRQQAGQQVHQPPDGLDEPRCRPPVGRVHPAGQVDEGERQQEHPERLRSRARREVAPVVALHREVVAAGEHRRAAHAFADDDDVLPGVEPEHPGAMRSSDPVDPQFLRLGRHEPGR
jgi:hypothetical protein